MRSTLIFILTAAIVLGFIAYWSTYTVRFTEVAVVTTFGKASEGSLREEAGIYPKWPFPIQSVTKYDTRPRLLQTRSETQLTRDNANIIVEAFLTWKVRDPLVFYQRFSSQGGDARDHFRAAERTLEALMRSGLAEVSGFELKELFAAQAGASKLPELERRILERLTGGQAGAEQLASYGVEASLVGINRVVLPQETTRAVFERMRSSRERLASEAQSQGEALAATIRNRAEADTSKIMAFARRRAAEIRSVGDREAGRWISAFNENPELAVFLKNLDLLREALGKRTTLVIPTKDWGMGVFDPSTIPEDGTIPSPGDEPQPPAAVGAVPGSGDAGGARAPQGAPR